MADRCTLALSKLDEFAEWASTVGYIKRPARGYYEVLRLERQERRKGKGPLLYFVKPSGGMQHASAQVGAASSLVYRWLRERA